MWPPPLAAGDVRDGLAGHPVVRGDVAGLLSLGQSLENDRDVGGHQLAASDDDRRGFWSFEVRPVLAGDEVRDGAGGDAMFEGEILLRLASGDPVDDGLSLL